MNLSYGGAVPDMHDTTLLDVGEYKSLLSIGDKQSMNFTSHDSGPFWMDSITKITTKYDKATDEIEVKDKPKVRLLVDLMK